MVAGLGWDDAAVADSCLMGGELAGRLGDVLAPVAVAVGVVEEDAELIFEVFLDQQASSGAHVLAVGDYAAAFEEPVWGWVLHGFSPAGHCAVAVGVVFMLPSRTAGRGRGVRRG